MSSSLFGGYGQIALGRHQFGAPASIIEPRFDTSNPVDTAVGVNTGQWITFSIYYYSSTVNFPSDILVEISENSGLIFVPAEAPDFELLLRVKDGQYIWGRLKKNNGTWPPLATIVIRYTGIDEFGQAVTKTNPVKWG